jgi:hypothetical protein
MPKDFITTIHNDHHSFNEEEEEEEEEVELDQVWNVCSLSNKIKFG